MQTVLERMQEYENHRKKPQRFSSPDDIEKFITERNLYFPLILDIIKYFKEGKLDVTTTESKVYMDAMFEYIYDVFKDDNEETDRNVIKWLDEYVQDNLRIEGFSYFKKAHFTHCFNKSWSYSATDFLPNINCFTEIKAEDENLDYYISKKPDIIEQYWIRTDKYSGQPIWVVSENEAYMRVHVYPDRVYIFGCDDMSWTFYPDDRTTTEQFSRILKKVSPVWNFSYKEFIHSRLKFTN